MWVGKKLAAPGSFGVLGYTAAGSCAGRTYLYGSVAVAYVQGSSKSAKIMCCITTVLLIFSYMFHKNVFVIDDRQHQKDQYMPSPKQYGGALGLQLRGRLGNQMFQYASILGLASMMKFERVIVEGGHELRDTFKFENDRVEFGKVPPYWKVVKSTQSGMFDENLTQLNNNSELQIEAFLESWKYFQMIESTVKKDFTFKSTVMSNAQKLLNAIIVKQAINISFTNVTYVGVHVRRGDFLNVAAVQKGLMVAPMEFILKAMSIMRILYGPDIIFIICSDDIPWVKKAISDQGHISDYTYVFMENNPPNVDLAVLSLCNQTIATTGTFSWWAAWLAGGTTIFYKHQARQGSEYRQKFNYDDFFYPHWILLE
ncbi:galactoside alpha-(1,2)-fucosyltransferase 1-like [Dreissena polymorpha]|nr:galactoside alpha-(1,2)-fucosyltransferase 1-like [Dreissena polymorpha]